MRIAEERFIDPFNGPVEIGLRTLAILNDAFPNEYSLQRLVVFDYLLVHSDDIPEGPIGLHPKTPHRSGELLVRRKSLRQGLYLLMSRGLVQQRYQPKGVFFAGTDHTGAFLDTLGSAYVIGLRDRAEWVVSTFGPMSDSELDLLVQENLGEWGAEFELESVLWLEETV